MKSDEVESSVLDTVVRRGFSEELTFEPGSH